MYGNGFSPRRVWSLCSVRLRVLCTHINWWSLCRENTLRSLLKSRPRTFLFSTLLVWEERVTTFSFLNFYTLFSQAAGVALLTDPFKTMGRSRRNFLACFLAGAYARKCRRNNTPPPSPSNKILQNLCKICKIGVR